MRIRVATADDAPGVAELAARTFILACPPETLQEDIDAHIAQRLNRQQFAQDIAEHHVVIAEDDEGRLVGYAMNVVGPPPIPQDWVNPVEVRRIYVEESLHGSGVADELMTTCLTAAAHGGHDQVWLGTNKANERALRFYRKHRFDIVGERLFQLADTQESDYVLARPAPTVEA